MRARAVKRARLTILMVFGSRRLAARSLMQPDYRQRMVATMICCAPIPRIHTRVWAAYLRPLSTSISTVALLRRSSRLANSKVSFSLLASLRSRARSACRSGVASSSR